MCLVTVFSHSQPICWLLKPFSVGFLRTVIPGMYCRIFCCCSSAALILTLSCFTVIWMSTNWNHRLYTQIDPYVIFVVSKTLTEVDLSVVQQGRTTDHIIWDYVSVQVSCRRYCTLLAATVTETSLLHYISCNTFESENSSLIPHRSLAP